MRSVQICTRVAVAAVLALLPRAVHAQITSNEADGVLNAPYRGTVDSLRECTMDIGYGEVKTHIEPIVDLNITSSDIDIWFDGDWDRSVLRMYQGVDASGAEIDLTGTSQGSPAYAPVIELPNGDRFGRFSFKAIGTKSLEVQEFDVNFYYKLESTWVTVTRTIKVAPVTGSFCSLPGESEAFHFGTPILDVAVGNARLTVPVGQTAEMIGAAFIEKDDNMGPTGIDTSDVVFPGSAESVHIQNYSQFRLGSYYDEKTAWGTPWPGHLIGYRIATDPFGPDGTHYDSQTSSSSFFRRIDFIRPFGLSEFHAAVQDYVYDGSDRVTEIKDQATTPNVITLHRTAGVVTRITTSDGRGWDIDSDPVDGWITAVLPGGDKGDRYFTYTDPAPGDPDAPRRVAQVKDAQQNVMYEFMYDFDADGVPIELLEEWRYVDGQLEKAIEHEIVSESLRRRKEYTEAGVFRQYDFAYDTGATPNPLNHRLASITAYSESNGAGTPYTTTYTHDVDNADGTMVITRVDLPDGTWIDHEYDSHVDTQTVRFGFRTKTTHSGPNDGSLVTYDVDYEFFYDDSGTRLFHRPRIVKERDGGDALSEVTYDYEDGGSPDDGEDTNRLLKQTGPTITLGTSGTRIPETRYTYDTTDRVLIGQETDYDAGTNGFRVIEFGHDELLRLTSETVYPDDDENLVTQYLYCDTQPTQDRIVIDPDGYWMRTRYDNDGRVATVERFLNADAGTVGQPCTDPSGPFYGTTYVYDTNGRLDQRIVDHKDQDGADLVPATITTQYTYDRLGRLTLQTLDPGGIGQEANFDYNWLGEIEHKFDTSGRGTERVYDGRGLVESETPLALGEAPDTNLTTSFEYDAVGNQTFTYPPTHPAGPHEERVYDDFGRLEDIKRHPGTDGGSLITTTFEYDAANNVTRTVAEEDGVEILSDATAEFDEGGFNYESRQRADAGTNGVDDVVTERSYDWAGNVTEERTLGDGGATVGDRFTVTTYDGANRVATVQDSEGGETVYDRDGRGNVTARTVKLTDTPDDDAVTSTEYDALSRPITITDPEDGQDLRHYRERRYDSRGNLRRETMRHASDTPKMTIVFAYDNAGRRTRRAVLADAGAITTPAADANLAVDRVVDFQYDSDGRLQFRTTYNNNLATPHITSTTYDDHGRVDQVTDPSDSYTDDDYSTDGLLEQRTIFDGLGTRTFTFDYDGHDRMGTQTAAGPPQLQTLFEYDGLDRQTLVTSPKGIKTKTEYDLVGRRAGVIEDYQGTLQRETVFAYNRLSQLIGQTATNKDSEGGALPDQATTYRYDTLGRQTRAVYPDAPSNHHTDPENCTDCVQMGYDLAGRMTGRTDQRPLSTTLAYDDRGLLLTHTTQIDVDTFVDTFDYDALGRLKLAERGTTGDPDAVSASIMAYTDLGDLDIETQTIAGDNTPKMVDYGYDQAGNRTQLTYPGGVMLSYTPTPLNLVESMTLGGQPLATYLYYEPTAGKPGRLLDTRTTTTDDPGGETSYEYDVDYDPHRRTNAITNRVHTPARGTETIAAYTFTHDNNGNPLSQSVITGMDDFVADDRVFTVDSLNRLTSTEYFESMELESTTLDLIGNRESHTNRAGETLWYALDNPANEYATIGGHSVGYDEAGNLSLDEAGRQYFYDEHNRPTQIKAANETALANYTYDALGRRITFEDPVAGITTRYYYDGQSVIEERDETDALLRYHVNGAQYIDERVATFEAARDGLTYYLPNRNFSIAGTGDAAGSVIDRLDYSAGGDFGGPATGYFFDADGDEDVDLNDYADFYPCLSGPDVDAGAACALHDFDGDDDVDLPDFDRLQRCFTGDGPAPPTVCLRSVAYYHDFDGDRDVDLDDYETGFYPCSQAEEPDARCLAIHDFDTDSLSDGSVDMADYGGFVDCSANGSGQAPPEFCLRSGFQDTPPAAGTFALHGRPVDVLSDDHVVQYSRARYYEPKHGRWLQRDPTGYTDGGNLYESFGGNTLRFVDPFGQDVYHLRPKYMHSYVFVHQTSIYVATRKEDPQPKNAIGAGRKVRVWPDKEKRGLLWRLDEETMAEQHVYAGDEMPKPSEIEEFSFTVGTYYVERRSPDLYYSYDLLPVGTAWGRGGGRWWGLATGVLGAIAVPGVVTREEWGYLPDWTVWNRRIQGPIDDWVQFLRLEDEKRNPSWFSVIGSSCLFWAERVGPLDWDTPPALPATSFGSCKCRPGYICGACRQP